MEWRVIEAKLFMERNIKTERKESKELGRDLWKYTRTRNFGGLRRQAELRNMTSTLIARIEDGMSKIKELRPTGAKNPYTIEDLDAELICMTMVHSLGKEYSHFASSLMLLKSLDKNELQAAFLAEESQRRCRPEGPGGDAALFTASTT
jgi:hypothetical protein